MQAINKMSQTKREYNPEDRRNQRLAQGSRTSRKAGTKSRERNRRLGRNSGRR